MQYNWNIVTGTLAVNQPAITSPGLAAGYVATTTLNSSDINVSTDLSWAKTLIHEAFHAYLVSIYRHQSSNPQDMTYIALINKYLSQFNNNLEDTQHLIFAKTNIINSISLALKEYGVSKGYTLPQQFYDDMAWGGLAGTSVFQRLPQAKQQRIVSTIEAEYKNNSTNYLNIVPKGNQICP